MKRRNYLYAAGFILAAAFASCTEDENVLGLQNGQVEVTVEKDVLSRTTLAEDNETVYWCATDQIYLFDSDGTSKGVLNLKEGAGETTATFSGKVTGQLNKIDKALYPVPTVKGGKYSYDFPAERNWTDNSAAPMIGELENKHVAFRNLAAMVRIDLQGYTYDENSELVLTMYGQKISGTAVVDMTDETLAIVEGGNSLTVTGIGSNVRFIDLPVPAGEYTNYIVTLNGVELAKSEESKVLTKDNVAILGQTKSELTPNENGEYEIRTAADMFWLAEQVNTGNSFEGMTVKLMNDIDMSLKDWTPIGGNYNGNARNFKGTFDGNEKTISGLKVKGGTYVALFGRTSGDCSIKDLTISNSYFEDGDNAACLVSFVLGNLTLNSVSAIESDVIASGTEYPNRLIGSVSKEADITIDGYKLVKTTDELSNALENNITKIYLAEGIYKLPNVKYKDVLLRGENLNAIVDYSHMGVYQEVYGSSFKFENMTVKCAEKGYPYPGLQHTTSVSYEKCHILGTVNLFSPATFKFCTFDSKNAEHNVVTYGSDEVTFENCEFTYADRSVNCYAENASGRDVKVAFTECKFTKVTGKETTGAIETNSSLMKSLTLTINNCSVNEGDLWWISSYDTMKGAKTSVIVNGMQTITTAEQLRGLAEKATGKVEVTLTNDITLGNETERCDAINFKNVTSLTIYGNDKTLTLKGKQTTTEVPNDTYVAGILAENANVIIKDLTIKNKKLQKDGTQISAARNTVYSVIRGTTVTHENVTFDGGVRVKTNETFKNCTFIENILINDSEGYAKNGKFCMFIDHEYNENKTDKYVVNLEGCTFIASGYGCVKVAGDKGANITVNVKGCKFDNTCPSNSWDKNTPKYDIKMTGENITVNDEGGNTWSSGRNAGIGEG